MNIPLSRRMIEVSGSETPWLEGGAQGHLLYARCAISVGRPAVPVLLYGPLMVRMTAPTAALARRRPGSHADEIKTVGGTGGTGPTEIITASDEASHYRRPVPGWVHAPHDTLVWLRPQSVTGFRLAHAEAVR
ncbi:hypothetical protein [Streptomyces sp. NRRL B-24720]|uniref:hypothetical protein n=1 Tax=Streptomyces sp. NRRL B-24720 TaxID=1476876 RepID=UPI0004CB837A|nr:hypothetical protein [Streptomyces sp. NRRL B-24720]